MIEKGKKIQEWNEIAVKRSNEDETVNYKSKNGINHLSEVKKKTKEIIKKTETNK